MKIIQYCVLFAIVTVFSTSVYSQKISWYFPEYKHYLRPNGNCNRTIKQSIWGWQYLKIKVYDSCHKVEVSCYRSKDSTLKEKGIYYMSRDTIFQNATVRQAGIDSTRTEKTQNIVFKRVGTWKFYNKTGRIIKTVNYKKEE